MAGLRSVTVDASHRARRWDAIVLGSGIPALVTAARLGMHDQRANRRKSRDKAVVGGHLVKRFATRRLDYHRGAADDGDQVAAGAPQLVNR